MNRLALILFAHGSRDPEWANQLARICASIRETSPSTRVEPAFLEFSPPSLPESASRLIREGYGRIIVVPVFLARGGHLKQDLPLLMDELRLRHPETTFELSGAVGEADSVIQAMASHILTLAGDKATIVR